MVNPTPQSSRAIDKTFWEQASRGSTVDCVHYGCFTLSSPVFGIKKRSQINHRKTKQTYSQPQGGAARTTRPQAHQSQTPVYDGKSGGRPRAGRSKGPPSSRRLVVVGRLRRRLEADEVVDAQDRDRGLGGKLGVWFLVWFFGLVVGVVIGARVVGIGLLPRVSRNH